MQILGMKERVREFVKGRERMSECLCVCVCVCVCERERERERERENERSSEIVIPKITS